jgi:hypothetical protein
MARGPHTADAALFDASHHADLRQATADLAWLLGRGYAEPSSLKLVGDRYRLRRRQRTAVRRCSCAPASARDRRSRRLELPDLRGRDVAIDGFNVVIIVETALSGGVVLRGLDSACRDLASVHGSYRRVAATAEALAKLRDVLVEAAPATVTWALDRPVSNSGRLGQLILAEAPDETWSVQLPHDADRAVLDHGGVVASADGNVLDHCGPWVDLPNAVIARFVPDAWIVDLAATEP